MEISTLSIPWNLTTLRLAAEGVVPFTRILTLSVAWSSDRSDCFTGDSPCFLLGLLGRAFRGRTIQPHGNKSQPAKHCDPDAANPHPCSTDLPTPWPFIVREVSNRNLPLLIDVGKEGTTIVDSEVENAVLVGSLECNTKDCCVGSLRYRREIETVKRREHAKLELNIVVGRENKGCEMIVYILGNFNLELLRKL